MMDFGTEIIIANDRADVRNDHAGESRRWPFSGAA